MADIGFFFLAALMRKLAPSCCMGSADLREAAVVSFTPLSTARKVDDQWLLHHGLQLLL